MFDDLALATMGGGAQSCADVFALRRIGSRASAARALLNIWGNSVSKV
jgi:hypothetical protein